MPAALPWDKWVNVAYLRMSGATQAEAAKLANIGRRTLERWEEEQPAKWERAKQEARSRWHGDLEDSSRMALLEEIRNRKNRGRGDLALRVLERMDTRLAPATQRHEHDWRLQLIQRAEALPVAEIERLAEEGTEGEILALLGRGGDGD